MKTKIKIVEKQIVIRKVDWLSTGIIVGALLIIHGMHWTYLTTKPVGIDGADIKSITVKVNGHEFWGHDISLSHLFCDKCNKEK